MNREKNLAHGNIKVTILDDDLDVISEQPGTPENTTGFTKIWVLADIYVFKKGKDHKKEKHQSDTFLKGITFEVPIPPNVLDDSFVQENGKEALSLIYYDKKKEKWEKFKGQVLDIENNKATVTLKKWIKDPPLGWGG
jgi:hypothetical protein